MKAMKTPGLLVMMLLVSTTALAYHAKPNIVEVAVAANAPGGPYEGQFDTLIAAIGAADPMVAEKLTARGQRTVFAPTDDAFDAALAELGVTLNDLVSNQELLTDILLYHVANGKRTAEDVVESSRVRTMERGFLFPDGPTLTDEVGRTANIIVTDIPAGNGVIHAIDRVVLPYPLA